MGVVSRRDDPHTGSAPPPGEQWTFDDKVTAAFEDMLVRSIPDYEQMREIVKRSANWLIDRGVFAGQTPLVVDLGASRGSALAPLIDRWGARARFLALEISDPMLDVLRARFKGMTDAGVVTVGKHDLRKGLPTLSGAATVIQSILTLQFVPIEYRQQLVRDCYERLMPGGGLIVVEKCQGETDASHKILTDLYYDLKRENGYQQDAIDRKRLALEGVLVPLTSSWNEQMFRAAGFETVEPIWSWSQFRGWLCVRR